MRKSSQSAVSAPLSRGTIALALLGNPANVNSGQSSFFFNLVDNVRLDHAYTVFAEVELFPTGGQPDWSEAVVEGTEALVVATGVRTEGSVIAMMDLNVGYMCGPLFAEPKRLKAAGPVPADVH